MCYSRYHKSLFHIYPALTLGDPVATLVQRVISSPTLPHPRPLTNTVKLPVVIPAE